MQLMLKDDPVLNILENGACQVLEFDRLPFALRKELVTYIDFADWAAGRALSISRSYAKEILNALRLSQSNSLSVCLACRGLSLTDSYWIRQPEDSRTWAEINLFQNELSFFVTELALSGVNTNQSRPKQGELYEALPKKSLRIHTPELTTMGASAKGWIRREDGLYLYKVGKHEEAASRLLDLLNHDHAFSDGKNVFSQTTDAESTLEEAAVLAQQELRLDVTPLLSMEKPELLEEEKWQAVLARCRKLQKDARRKR